MKWVCVSFLMFLFLSGCDNGAKEMERAMELRSRILKADSCSFEAEITADYGNKLQTFTLSCQGNAKGDIAFQVVSPDTISGITGTIREDAANLKFNDVALPFSLLADGQLSPVSAPWIFLRTLRSGYLTAVCNEEGLRLTIDDSYEEDALQLDIWLNDQDLPIRGEILYDGKRILSLNIKDFTIL